MKRFLRGEKYEEALEMIGITGIDKIETFKIFYFNT